MCIVRVRFYAVAAAAAASVVAGPAAAAARAASGAVEDTECRTSVQGSEGVAVCFNPDPDVDHVQLHIECAQWWDPDVDGSQVPVGPAETVTLSDRCWEEISSVWVTRLPDGSGS
ncbi:hypothetical protein ACIP98_08410 [Streptomyces sp. NPDC088354]|uniref:hypothetical protein n=1 Tax=Streptomyces sp. NPDC088354 TaxID=3365856 RepID=UPI0037F43A11